MKKYPLSRRDNLVIQQVADELMIYDLTANKAFCLNETSAIVWQNCDGQKGITEISNILTDKLKAKTNEDLVWFALEQLKKENLIEDSNEIDSPFLGMSRREVIKQVGFGTVVALPVIASMVAPNAINAASSCLTPITDTTCNCVYQDGNNNNGPGGPRVIGFCVTIPLTMLGANICNDTSCRCQINDVSDPNCPVLAGTGSAQTHVCAGMCVV